MNIGITYDLRSDYLALGFSEDETAEFDRDDTIVAIEKTLNQLGHTTERIGHIRHLTTALSAGRRWDLVFNIAEGMYGIGREAQVPALLDAYHIPYTFSDPLVMSLTLHKAMTKMVLRDAGVATSDFLLAQELGDTEKIHFEPPYFIKPLAEGTGKGIGPDSIIRTTEDLAPGVARLLATYRQPVLIEPYLPGREFTVALLGTGSEARAIGSMEVILLAQAEQGVYSYTNKENCEELVEYRLVSAQDDPVVAEGERIALAAWRVLGCRDGGRIDIRCDADNKPQFIEVNPLAGIHPEHSDLPIICTKIGLSYTDLIDSIVTSAAQRISR
ncbi:MAG: D-alanine--D-alanine ligase [Proteobacteria bacterium]|nr:D-alanine--D-alanine ligase [Pseudomonadota bacterium]MBU1687353.1 D-alanine--D-alanine ligase [Pseudomonadota bacterium]